MAMLELFGVPYEMIVEDGVPSCAGIESAHYAAMLEVRSRFNEKYAGFTYHDDNGSEFIYVDVEGELIEFSRLDDDRPITIEVIEQFFQRNLEAMESIGYECLEPEPR